jgi:predicted anti-sigma-YlaC factor YlaD
MSCIKNDIIQKYIDGEATPKEVALIKKHIVNCEKCAVKVDNQQRLVAGIKKAINLLTVESKVIPKLVISPNYIKRRFLTRKRFIYSISAACILMFVFVFLHKKKPENHNQITIVYSLEPVVDANLPITKQQLVINVIDSKGNVTEYYIK